MDFFEEFTKKKKNFTERELNEKSIIRTTIENLYKLEKLNQKKIIAKVEVITKI